MYKTFSASDYKKYLGFSEDYHIEGMLCYGTWNKQKQIPIFKQAMADLGKQAEFNSLPEFLGRMTEFVIDGKRYWFDISYGGALLSEYLHLACLFGSKKNIVLGSCGGLSLDVNPGDLIIPTYSFGNESSTRMYSPDEVDNKHFPDENLSKSLQEKIKPDFRVLRGATTTSQAMMGETLEHIKKWSAEGFLGVEMEASTVFAVSKHFGVPSAGLIYMTDNLIKEETVLDESFKHGKERKEEVVKEQYRVALEELLS